ncbi:hypothetical protein G6M89_04775 [Natronolimnobius sp. AArcel1]|uniref:hypothetical protein n=1 Tax=Natronolimnobius sp. AArcel1 TaxID=1679093 RepID=UPI0013EC9D24|nr:hypothetical protein [Natronolimnobius sp. AArcel1]NGM68329.1 hypothetical protein [Natronolimnobius sp. AArcel1]
MTKSPLAAIEQQLDRATELEADAAMATLRDAQDRLRELDGDSRIDDDRRAELEDRVKQRLRTVSERGAYNGGLGSAMNPSDDDAP